MGNSLDRDDAVALATGSKLNFLDRAIAYVAPERAVERAVARYWMREFSRGDEQRERGKSGGRTRHASSESSRKQRDRINKIWDARDMEENFCFVRGILDRLEQYVCGEMTYQSRTGVPELDAAYQDYFHDWCGRADITGRFRFREMVAQGFRATVRDGEHGWIMLTHGTELRLQAIEADRIGGPDNPKADSKNVGGILINELGQITGYEIYRRDTMAKYVKEGVSTPEHFIHLYKAIRSDQYHGESWLGPALPHARDIHELFRFEKQAMKFASAFAGFIKSKDPTAPAGGTSWKTKKGGVGGTNSFEVEAGMIRRLMEGEDIVFPGSTGRPSSNLMQFVEILIREMALGLNLPYGFVYNMSQLGGVTARIELMQVVRSIRRWQKLLEDVVLTRVKDAVLTLGIAVGEIPFHPNWNHGKWSFGGRLTGDSGNYVQEMMILLQNGLISPSDIIEEMTGSSNAEILAKIATDIQEAREKSHDKGVPLELLAPGRFQGATQLFAAINSPPQEPPPEPRGLVLREGEKAAKPMMEVLEKYSEGRMEREQAISQLVYLYGVTRTKAEKWLPAKPPPPPDSAGGDSRPGDTDAQAE